MMQPGLPVLKGQRLVAGRGAERGRIYPLAALAARAVLAHEDEDEAREPHLPVRDWPAGRAVVQVEGVDGQRHRQARQHQHYGDVHP